MKKILLIIILFPVFGFAQELTTDPYLWMQLTKQQKIDSVIAVFDRQAQDMINEQQAHINDSIKRSQELAIYAEHLREIGFILDNGLEDWTQAYVMHYGNIPGIIDKAYQRMRISTGLDDFITWCKYYKY